MTGIITTGSIPKALWPGLNAIWGRNYTEKPMQYPELFDLATSDKRYEEDVEITGFGLAPVKPEGQAIQYDSETQAVVSRYTHVAYALGFVITHEAFKDNQYAEMGSTRTRALAWSMRQTKELVHANVYNNGFDATNYPIADGVAAFSASHPTANGNQSNILSTAADLSEASLEDQLINIANAKNGRGLRIALRGEKLIVPTNLQFEATRILKSNLQNDSANNAINAVRAMGMLPGGIAVNNYLTDTDAWFIKTDCPNGFRSFQREEAMFDEDNDGDTKNQKYMAYERYSAGVTDWRGVYGTPGA